MLVYSVLSEMNLQRTEKKEIVYEPEKWSFENFFQSSLCPSHLNSQGFNVRSHSRKPNLRKCLKFCGTFDTNLV